MDKPALFAMDDPFARVNVMGYDDGQALNCHFDRSEFTTTLLLRGDGDPNYDSVADLLEGRRNGPRYHWTQAR